jgi:hypothetical protein
MLRFSLRPFCKTVVLLLSLGSGAALADESDLRADDRLFRSIYGAELEKSGYSAQEIPLLHFTFPETFKEFIESCHRHATRIEDCDSKAAEFRPSQILKGSPSIPPLTPPMDLAAHRPTFIILPGYIAELAETIPYRDILDEPSQLRTRWEQQLQQIPDSMKTAVHFSIVAGREVNSPVGTLIRAASLDQEDGQELAHVFVMQHPRGSLESVGQLSENADRLIPRIRQLDQIMPLEGPVYLVGYSRGANVAMEILSRLPQLQAQGVDPWVEKIAGMISLSGPLFGTPLGDSQGPHTLAGLLGFAKDLQTCAKDDSFWERHKKIHNNTQIWKKSIAALVRDAGTLGGAKELQWEGIRTGAIDLRMGWQVIKGVLFQDLFRLSRPVREYCENVERFKLFVSKTIEGTEVMSTRSMQTWFETHTLPPALDYISVAATMMDASTPEAIQPEGSNTLSYAPGSADLQLSRNSYYQIVALSGFQINDGFVPLHRSLFLPRLHQRLNPAQEPYQARYGGALWQHHLGIAIPMGIPMSQAQETPFPRRDFLEALVRLAQSRS